MALLTSTSNIGIAIAYQYPAASPVTDYTVTWDGTQFALTSWNLPDPLPTSDEIEQWYLSALKQQALAQLKAGFNQTIAQGFQCTINGTTYTFGWQMIDQLHLQEVQYAIDKGIESFPIEYADIHGNIVIIPDQATLTALEQKAHSFAWAQVKQFRQLNRQVQSATTPSQVEGITWTPAAY
jgi:hypothetical protein